MGASQEQPSEAKAAKEAADAIAANAAARKAVKEAAEYESPLAQQAREAERSKAIAESLKATALAQQQQLTALLPDLSKVDRGQLTTDSKTMLGSALAQRALEDAGEKVAGIVERANSSRRGIRILVTSDPDLLSADATFHSVKDGLRDLAAAAEQLLTDPPAQDDTLSVHLPWLGVESLQIRSPLLFLTPIATKAPLLAAAGASALLGGPVGAAIGAVAAAAPAVLSLMSAHRAVSTTEVSIDDVAACAATSGALVRLRSKPGVIHDSFRLLPSDGEVASMARTLSELRRKLVAKKLELSQSPDNTGQRSEASKARADADTVRIALIDSLTSAMDAFLTAATTAGAAKRSPLDTAAALEQIHTSRSDGKPHVDNVLLIRGLSGSAAQLVDDKPLWFEDKFSAVSSVSVTYMLIDTEDGSLIDSGVVSGTAVIHGKIGDRFSTEIIEPQSRDDTREDYRIESNQSDTSSGGYRASRR